MPSQVSDHWGARTRRETAPGSPRATFGTNSVVTASALSSTNRLMQHNSDGMTDRSHRPLAAARRSGPSRSAPWTDGRAIRAVVLDVAAQVGEVSGDLVIADGSGSQRRRIAICRAASAGLRSMPGSTPHIELITIIRKTRNRSNEISSRRKTFTRSTICANAP